MAKNIACFACTSYHELPRQVIACLLELRESYWELMDDQGWTSNERRLQEAKADMPLLEAELAYWSK